MAVFRERADQSKQFQKSKHCDRKETQQLEGKQVFESLLQYDQSILEELPPEIREKCKCPSPPEVQFPNFRRFHSDHVPISLRSVL